MDRDEMLRALRAFQDHDLEYILVGAAAMGVHGVVRATEDVDIFIRATSENVARLKQAFRTVYGADPSIDEISADDLLGEYPAVRYYPPSGDLYFDILTRLGTAASFESVEAELRTSRGCASAWQARALSTVSRRTPCARSIARTRRCFGKDST